MHLYDTIAFMKVMIKEASKKFKGYSLYKLAHVMNIPQQTVYSWANGKTQPSYKNLDRICTILDCKIEDLLEAEPFQNMLSF